MNANLLLWIGQILLALAFAPVGLGHSLGFGQMATRPGMDWMAAVGRDQMRIIGGLEVLGAIGLILPAALHILPWLATLAAACLAVLMAFAVVFHARRPAEGRNIVLNVILGAIALLIVYGRLVVAPF
jgi:putative oxidoreductase